MEVIMTEREKMQAGELYDCGDVELLTQWHKAKDLARDYNNIDSADAKEKERILTELLGGKVKIYGLHHLFMLITGIIFILEITAK